MLRLFLFLYGLGRFALLDWSLSFEIIGTSWVIGDTIQNVYMPFILFLLTVEIYVVEMVDLSYMSFYRLLLL